ncbi:MAG: tRNA (adenosine(37)-N6)-threonylcarbamoyltransferase complex dimerization subunit type 1 TsaB [Thalassobaculaceae bacterium]|nr:tRNA (adenosine(37)-N6)-threonylcarbamoyltransferase complex dimerization subunit type 1 TsaB [Thalassobaculaceae bacterium]
MSLLLAIDSSAGACSVAVAESGEPRAFEVLRLSRGHAEVLMPMVERVLVGAGCTACDIRVVTATIGPGSFTGLRIGLAAARGLALAVDARTVPVTSLAALAHAAGCSDMPLLTVLDSKRGDVYAQWFDGAGAALAGPAVMTVSEAVALAPAQRFRLAGDVADALVAAARDAGREAVVLDGCDLPDARSVAAVAADRLAAGEDGPLRPLYLRAPAVNLPAS